MWDHLTSGISPLIANWLFPQFYWIHMMIRTWAESPDATCHLRNPMLPLYLTWNDHVIQRRLNDDITQKVVTREEGVRVVIPMWPHLEGSCYPNLLLVTFAILAFKNKKTKLYFFIHKTKLFSPNLVCFWSFRWTLTYFTIIFFAHIYVSLFTNSSQSVPHVVGRKFWFWMSQTEKQSNF